MNHVRLSAARADREPIRATVLRRLSRPSGILEGTRWLFWVLAMLSLLLAAPPIVAPSQGGAAMLSSALVVIALAVSNTAAYLKRSSRWLSDLCDAVLLLAAASVAPSPPVMVAYLMALIWFRSLYGSRRQALVRCGLFAAALVLSTVAWPYVPGHEGRELLVSVVAILPVMFLTTIAGRHLAGILTEREEASALDAVHGSAGQQLLGVTDPDEVMRIAWETATRLGAVAPGLRVLRLAPDDSALRVTGAVGDFAKVPTTLSPTIVGVLAHDGSADVEADALRPLDVAVGRSCRWRSASLTGQREGTWLLIGSPTRTTAHAADVLVSFVMHVILAVRSSAAHQTLTVQATMDNLTGLANRSLFNVSLESALEKAADRHPVSDTAVLFVDLDDFKDVNDILGHAAGDELLREVALRLRGATRSHDLCARLGGDEFAVLLYRTDAETATAIGQRIVQVVSEPMRLADGVGRVGASIGVAVCSKDTTPEQLVQRADVAMYAAKAAGKGRVQLYSDGLLRDDDESLVMDRQIHTAVENDELTVLYQPIVSLQNDRCTAAQAVVQWTHPTRGLLLPADFNDAAERTGAIRDIGRFAIGRACADAAEWQRSRPDDPIAVHVDVSAVQLEDDRFHSEVRDLLADLSVPADRLILVVDETVVLASPVAIAQLDALTQLGVLVAVDDFGMGYGGLSTLRALPVSAVRLGASFVAGSTVNQEDRAAAEAIIAMATRLGLDTVAVGVERPDQRVLFQSLGATSAQGSLYARSIGASELCNWLELREPPVVGDGGVLVPFPERRSGQTR